MNETLFKAQYHSALFDAIRTAFFDTITREATLAQVYALAQTRPELKTLTLGELAAGKAKDSL